MAKGDILTTTKHKFPRVYADEGGTPAIILTGALTIDNYASNGFAFDISADIPTLEGVIFSGDLAGYVYQYDFSAKKIKVYEAAADGNPLDEVTDDTDIGDPDIRFFAWGY